MLSFDAPLTLREFMAHEELPLATVFREVFTFLTGRVDAVVFGPVVTTAGPAVFPNKLLLSSTHDWRVTVPPVGVVPAKP